MQVVHIKTSRYLCKDRIGKRTYVQRNEAEAKRMRTQCCVITQLHSLESNSFCWHARHNALTLVKTEIREERLITCEYFLTQLARNKSTAGFNSSTQKPKQWPHMTQYNSCMQLTCLLTALPYYTHCQIETIW